MTRFNPAMAPEGDNSKAGDTPVRLLEWYDAHHRELPWRVSPSARANGAINDPYLVWLSEVMLQQTTVEAVKAYYRAFLEKWPTVAALSEAETDDVMKAWAGLGYYSRARNLKKCADHVAQQLGGAFPDHEAGLLALPGIGPYTAAAIAAIAFNRPATVVDGNVERVITRLYAIVTPLPEAKPEIKKRMAALTPQDRPGDFAQAMMDLGATICTPKRPSCLICPLNDDCIALKGGDPALYPVKPEKKAKPVRRGAAFVAVRGDGAVLLTKRPDEGLLGGMVGPPTTDWNSRQDGATSVDAAPFTANWRAVGTIRHVFTHFELELTVYRADISIAPPHGMFWSSAIDLPDEALPTLMKKAIEQAVQNATKRKPAKGNS